MYYLILKLILKASCTMEEEHGILTFYNGGMFSLPHFQFKSIKISTIIKKAYFLN